MSVHSVATNDSGDKFEDGSLVHIRICPREPDLLAGNYIDRELRKDAGCNVWETARFGKNRNGGMNRFRPNLLDHSLDRPFGVPKPDESQYRHRWIEGIPRELIDDAAGLPSPQAVYLVVSWEDLQICPEDDLLEAVPNRVSSTLFQIGIRNPFSYI